MSKIKIIYYTFLLVIVSSIIGIQLVSAQSTIFKGIEIPEGVNLNFPDFEDFVTVSLTPENPGPNQKINLRIEFYSTDLQKAEIIWSINGEVKERGIGKTRFSFQTGKAGTLSKISITIKTFEGETIVKDVLIRPAEVDLIWNASTYSPPFYEGKALFTNQSEVAITALPNFINSSGGRINDQSLIYNWYNDDSFIQNQSGFGKRTITLFGKIITRPLNIRVEVKTLDESVVASQEILIPVETPKVLVYEKSLIYGLLLEKSLDNLEMNEQEITLSAVPYFFSTLLRESSNLNYSWTQNNTEVETGDQKSSIILRQTDNNITGKVNIGVRVNNKDNQIQFADFNTEIDLVGR